MGEFKYNDTFPTRLRALIDERNATQSEMALSAGVSRQAISQYANGESVPNADKLAKLASYFGVSADYLLGLTDVKRIDMDMQAISRETGLDEDVIARLQKGRDNYLFKKIINHIFKSDILHFLYKFYESSLYGVYTESDYFELVKMNPPKDINYPRITFADLIEYLPISRDELDRRIEESSQERLETAWYFAKNDVDIEDSRDTEKAALQDKTIGLKTYECEIEMITELENGVIPYGQNRFRLAPFKSPSIEEIINKISTLEFSPLQPWENNKISYQDESFGIDFEDDYVLHKDEIYGKDIEPDGH